MYDTTKIFMPYCRALLAIIFAFSLLISSVSAEEPLCLQTCQEAVEWMLEQYYNTYKYGIQHLKMKDLKKLAEVSAIRSAVELINVDTATLGVVIGLNAKSKLSGKRLVTVGVVQEGDSRLFDKYFATIQAELKALNLSDVEIVFKNVPAFNAQYQLNRLNLVLSNALNDPEVDLILTPSLLITQIATSPTVHLNKPLISAFIQKENFFELAFSKNGKSKVPNLSFTVIPNGLINDLKAFQEMIPFRHLHILVDELFLRADPVLAKGTINLLEKQTGYQITPVGVKTAADALEQLGPDVEAVYFATLGEMSEAEHQKLIEGVNAKKIPSFSLLGRTDVKKGILGGLSPTLLQRIARRAALNIQQVVAGESPNELSVYLPLEGRLEINLLTAQQIGYEPTIEMMQYADLYNEDKVQPGRVLTLNQAIDMALENNTGIAISEADLASAIENPKKILSSMLPQININSLYLNTDDPHAILPPGKQALVGFEITQMLFDDDVITGYYVAGKAAEKKVYDDFQVKLDVVENVSNKFLDLLYVKDLLRIEKKNFDLIRDNLELARLRFNVGASGKEDIYRWEAESALRRSSIVNQESLIKRARAALDQILAINGQTPWLPVPVTLEDKSIAFFHKNIMGAIKTHSKLKKFTTFSVQYAKEIDPVLIAFDRLIEGQYMQLSRNRRSNAVPKVYAGFKYGYELHRYGLLENLLGIPRDQWIFTLSLSLPIYDGDGRTHRVRQAQADLEKLIQSRIQAAQLIEQRVLDSIYKIESSYPRIKLAKEGFEKAELNLTIVRDRYSAGNTSIVDLLDAQTQSLEQEKLVSTAITQFLKDIVAYQRSISWFEYLQSDQEKASWLEMVKNYIDTEKDCKYGQN